MKSTPRPARSWKATARTARNIASLCLPAPAAMSVKRSKLQLLFDLAQRTFAEHSQPTPTQVDVLKLALSSVPLAELGIEHSEDCACAEDSCPGHKLPSQAECSGEPPFCPDQHAGPRPPITYLHIHEDENLSLGIFCLPANAQIPLHNHPGMTVMSRVLYGKMHVKSYDWVDKNSEEKLPRKAQRVLDRVLSARDEPAVLFPASGGNIHQFTAMTDCAVLDLLSPPYSTDDGRDCMYYREAASGHEDRGPVLEEYDPPTEFTIDSGVYRGIAIRSRPYLLRSILAAAAGVAACPAFPGDSSLDTAHTQHPEVTDSVSEAANSAPAALAGTEVSSSRRSSSEASTQGGSECGAPMPATAAAQPGAGAKSAGAAEGQARRGTKKSHRRRLAI